jgi:hypothetical protein
LYPAKNDSNHRARHGRSHTYARTSPATAVRSDVVPIHIPEFIALTELQLLGG